MSAVNEKSAERLKRDPFAYVWFTPRVGIALPGLAVQGIRAAAALQLDLEASGFERVVWNTDNGFSSSSYLTDMQKQAMERALRILAPMRSR